MRRQAFIHIRDWRRGQPMEKGRNRMIHLVGRGWDQVKSPLYRNAFFIMLTSVIGNGLGFFFWVVIGNTYQKQDAGAAVVLFQTLAFVGTIGNLGLGIGLIRYLPETDDKTSLINAGLTLAGLVSLVLSIGFLVAVPLLLPGLTFVLQQPFYILTIIACTVALGLGPIIDSAAIAARRADLQTIRNTIFAVLKIPLALGVSVVVAAFLLRRVFRGYFPRPNLQLSRVRPIFRFSFGNYIAGVIATAGTTLPTALIIDALGPIEGPTNAFYFYVALVVATLLYIIPSATLTSFYAEASQTNADHRKGERQAILLSVGLLIPAIAVMWLFSDTMLRWFGVAGIAEEAVTPLRILTFASIPVFLNGVLGTRVRVRKRTLPLIIAATITTVITLGLGWLLLQNPDLGIDGLAYAYVLGQAAATPYLYIEAREAYEALPADPALGQPLE